MCILLAQKISHPLRGNATMGLSFLFVLISRLLLLLQATWEIRRVKLTVSSAYLGLREVLEVKESTKRHLKLHLYWTNLQVYVQLARVSKESFMFWEFYNILIAQIHKPSDRKWHELSLILCNLGCKGFQQSSGKQHRLLGNKLQHE